MPGRFVTVHLYPQRDSFRMYLWYQLHERRSLARIPNAEKLLVPIRYLMKSTGIALCVHMDLVWHCFGPSVPASSESNLETHLRSSVSFMGHLAQKCVARDNDGWVKVWVGLIRENSEHNALQLTEK